jgi:hypothetical protein
VASFLVVINFLVDGRWVAKFIARLLASAFGSSLGSNPDISQKYKMGHKQWSGYHNLAFQKIYKKTLGSCQNDIKDFFLFPICSFEFANTCDRKRGTYNKSFPGE